MNGAHVIELLLAGARAAPDAPAYIFPDEDGGERRLTRAGLLRQVQRLAGGLQRRCASGDRVAIQLPQGESYVTVFWACLYAGLVPVPLYPSANADVRRRLAGIVADSGARLSVCAGAAEAGQVDVAALLADGAEAAAPAPVAPSTLAYLQYSSGSTGAPKGVVISHANIMANLAMIAAAAGVRGDDVFVNWLPLHHDLGLVNTVLLPLAMGCPSVIGTPLSFMRNPLSWLTRMSRYGGTISGAPNFAYQAVVDRLHARGPRAAAQLAELDLRRWRVAFNAAEPIQSATLEAFLDAFAPAGFAEDVFFAAYGMAEATVFVCGAHWRPGRERDIRASQAGAAQLAGTIACGPADGHAVLIADAEGRRAAPGVEGEIWIRGPHVGAGYFGRADDQTSPFRRHLADGEGPFFATGDSGVIEGGQLYVLGRIKEMIIQNGRNIYPTDIEQVAAAVLAAEPASEAGYTGCAAIGQRQGGTEAVLLVLEARVHDASDDAGLLERVAARVFEEQGVLIEAIIVVPRGSITKTSSGKLRRQVLRQALEAGALTARRFQPRAGDDPGAAEAATDAALEAQVAGVLAALTGEAISDARRSLFALGLSSMQIYQLVAELNERFAVVLTVREVFEHPSLRGLAGLLAERLAAGAEAPPAPAPDAAALSANQQMMLSIEAWSPANPAYHLPLVLAFDGGIDPHRLADSARKVLMRHEILRTVYPSQAGGRYYPTVLDAAGFRITIEPADADALGARLHALTVAPFALERDYPLRGHILTTGPQGPTVLVLVVHHIAADGWSLRLLADAIVTACDSGVPEQTRVPFVFRPAPPARHAAALRYWKAALAAAPDVHSLPLDVARGGARDRAASGRHALHVPPAKIDALRALCAGRQATLFSGVHALVALALARFGNQADIVLGTFLAGRDGLEQHGQIGFLAQTALLRTRVDLAADIGALVTLCRDTLLDAHQHADVSYMDLLRELKPARDPSYNPLFQISLNYHDYGVDEVRCGGTAARLIDVDTGVARYDLSVDVHPHDGGLRLEFNYDRALFEPASIARLADFCLALLDSALAAPHAPVSRLAGYAPPAIAAPPDGQASLYRRFRAQADATPDAIALRYLQDSLSYRQLAAEADRIAALIGPAAPGARVLIFMHRTPRYVAAILAILRRDCTYVPLDPDYYQDAVAERIGFIAPACVLADDETAAALAGADIGVPLIVVPAASGDAPAPRALAGAEARGHHPAYILFTSGSTGSPKAVAMGHAALDNLITAISADLNHAQPVVLNYSSIAFDMHFTEVFTALLNGGTVVLAGAAMRRNTLALLGLLAEERVSVLNLSYPVLCELALGAEQAGVTLPALRMVFSTAQQLKITPGLRQFFARHPAARLFNHYGPTETHVVTIAALGQEPADWPDVPDIGRPIGHTDCIVMNACGVAEAPGAIGELYVAGVALADGYYANQAMSAERFVLAELGGGRRVRAYRTGDFVRIRPDGALQYAGRKDHEIKIRGLRVDLSDIEASLQGCDGVTQAVVIARPSGAGMQIVAYVQLANGAPATATGLAAELRQTLPSYMVPDRFMLVDGFQLNQNGKIDLARLPAPADEGTAPAESPRTPHEVAVHEVWCKVLGHDAIGRRSNFFEVGGDSLALMAVKRELDLRYHRDIDLVTIYGSPTIASLAELVAEVEPASHVSTLRPRQNLNSARRQRLAQAKNTTTVPHYKEHP